MYPSCRLDSVEPAACGRYVSQGFHRLVGMEGGRNGLEGKEGSGAE